MKNQQEWKAQIAKIQTLEHNEEYTPNGKNTHQYTILEHEVVVLFDRFTGDYKVVRCDIETIEKALQDNKK